MQSSSHNVTTDKPKPNFLRGRIPSLTPSQQCRSTEGKRRIIGVVYGIFVKHYIKYSLNNLFYLMIIVPAAGT